MKKQRSAAEGKANAYSIAALSLLIRLSISWRRWRSWRDVDISSSGRLRRRLKIGLTIMEEKVWFEFLQVAVGNRESLSGGILDADWQRLFDFCKKQALIGGGFTAVEKRNVLLNEKPMYWGGRTLDDLCAEWKGREYVIGGDNERRELRVIWWKGKGI